MPVSCKSSLAVLFACVLWAPAFADETDASLEEVVVSATRIDRPGFSAPTPVTSISEAEIETRAPTTLADVLSAIPSFRATASLGTSGVNSRTGGQVTADLRGLGPTRTLVLVDGRRFVSTATDGTVDLKMIPTLLVDQVQVVTGGASAAWGSDAVAGVVNFILKDKIEGVQATVQYGESQRGDDDETKVSFATGGSGFDGRLHFTLGADFLDNQGIGSQYSRDWGRQEVGLLTNTAYATNGLPNYIIAPNVHTAAATDGGIIISGPLKGTAFGPGGAPYQFNYGKVFGTSMIGGTTDGYNPGLASELAPPIRTIVTLSHVDFDVSDKLSIFLEGSVADAHTGGASQEPRDAATVIQRDNAYLPSSIAQEMTALNLSSITIGRTDEDIGRLQLNTNDQTYRIVAGMKGSLWGSWHWDTYYQYGYNRYHLRAGPNDRIVANYAQAVDAVYDANGQIVCRSTLTHPGNGCIPIDVFGDGAEKLDNYAFGTAIFTLSTREQVAALNLQGDLFELPAGPVSLAFGTEYRQESGNAQTDPLSSVVNPITGQIGAYGLGNQVPFSGEYHVREAYAETVLPVFKDQLLAKSLDLNAAIRATDYSISGSVTTWKLGLTWQPEQDWRLRGTLSRDIRAPNLQDLFLGGPSASNYAVVFDPVRGTTVQVQQAPKGNLNLVPEVALTKSAGFVWQPAFIRNLGLSVDYYNIDIQHVIAALTAPQLASGCFAGVTAYCSSIHYNPDGTIAYVTAQELNLNRQQTDGVDLEGNYNFPLSDLGRHLAGQLAFRALATYVNKFVTIDPAGYHDYAGQLSGFGRLTGVPHWTATADTTYRLNGWMFNLEGHMVGAGKYGVTLTEGAGAVNTVNRNDVPAYFLFNLTGRRTLVFGSATLEIYALIDNLFDKAPPLIPSGQVGGSAESSTNAVFYDVIGRNFKLGVRLKM